MYVENGVALPKPEFCRTDEDVKKWKSLSKKEFMKKYGKDTLAQYNHPTDEELACVDAYDAGDNDEDDEDEDDEDEDL